MQIQYEQFMQSLAANLKNRLMSCNQNTEPLLSAINVLDPLQWPRDCKLTYGQEGIVFLCDVFHLNEFEATTRKGLHEYIDIIKETGFTGNREPPAALLCLTNAVNTIVVSSADCERSFSQMNILATPARSSLH